MRFPEFQWRAAGILAEYAEYVLRFGESGFDGTRQYKLAETGCHRFLCCRVDYMLEKKIMTQARMNQMWNSHLKVKNIQHLRWSYYDRSLRKVLEITCDKISIICA